MKDIVKSVFLLVVGLVAVIFVYPLLHEAGHCIFALLTGSVISEISLFPQAYTECTLKCEKQIYAILTSFGGIIFPYLAALFIRGKGFILWYIRFVLICVSILYCFVSLVCVMLYSVDISINGDDASQLVRLFPNSFCLCFVLLSALLFIFLIGVSESGAVKRIRQFFDV